MAPIYYMHFAIYRKYTFFQKDYFDFSIGKASLPCPLIFKFVEVCEFYCITF